MLRNICHYFDYSLYYTLANFHNCSVNYLVFLCIFVLLPYFCKQIQHEREIILVFCFSFVGVCIFHPPVLSIAASPGPEPHSRSPALALSLYLPALAPNLYLPVLIPNFYLPALAYDFITSPGPEFAYTKLVSSICKCIYGPDLQFVLPVRSLNMHLPYFWLQQWQQ